MSLMKFKLFILIIVFTSSKCWSVEVATFHCNGMCPKLSDSDSIVLVRNLYTMSFNFETKFANWVAYKLDKRFMGDERDRNWTVDNWVGEDRSMSNTDYEGAYLNGGFDRGHLAPLASFSASPDWSETNILTNVFPQNANLNRGAWRQLEAKLMKLSNTYSDIYVIDGVFSHLSSPNPVKLPNSMKKHVIATHVYKIAYVPSLNGGEYIAFLFENKSGNILCKNKIDIEYLESIVGVNFLPGRVKMKFSKIITKELGCE